MSLTEALDTIKAATDEVLTLRLAVNNLLAVARAYEDDDETLRQVVEEVRASLKRGLKT